MPAPELFSLVNPNVANGIRVPIEGVPAWLSLGWQLANPDDAQYLVEPPAPPAVDVITRDELEEFAGALPATFVSQILDPTSDIRAALDSLYGSPVSNIPTLASTGPGWSIKAGSLDRYRASKADTSKLTEVVKFGDSTLQGSGDEALGGIVPELRRQALADGLGDGGQGIAQYGRTAGASGDDLATVFAQTATGVTNGNQFEIFNANTPKFSTVGQSITFQGRGTRLRLYYGRQSGYARFSYAVDGGSATTVDPLVGFPGGATSRIGVVEVALTEGLHKVIVTNLGVVLSTRPSFASVDLGSPTTEGFTSGTYYYVVTGVTASGESLPSNVSNGIGVPNGPRHINMQINNSVAEFTGYKVYRGTSSTGPFQLIGSQAKSGGSFTGFDDDNSATPGANAPTTDTSGVTATGPGPVAVDTEWTRASGIVFHNQGVSGSDFGSYFSNPNPNINTAAQAALGRVQGGTQSTDDAQAAAASPPWRKPVLATCALGINNQTGDSASTAVITSGATKFAKFCVNGGIDGILIVPHFEHSTGDPQAAANKAAIIAVADEYGLSWVAYDQALNAGGYAGPNQHLDHTGYVLEAQFLWDNVLSK